MKNNHIPTSSTYSQIKKEDEVNRILIKVLNTSPKA